jgi:hypothetical protein
VQRLVQQMKGLAGVNSQDPEPNAAENEESTHEQPQKPRACTESCVE